MLFCLNRNELDLNPQLRDQMFEHRREEFYERLGWDLKIDSLGREIDQYDGLNPLYVILTDETGNHLASVRLLPTTGRTMIRDIFSDVIDPKDYISSHAWEVTRVFVARRDRNSVRNAAALFWGGCHMGMSVGVRSVVSITPKLMTRVFGACGWKGEILQTGVDAQESEICACRWPVNQDVLETLKRRAGSILDDVSPPSLKVVPWNEQTIGTRSIAPHAIPNPETEPQHYG